MSVKYKIMAKTGTYQSEGKDKNRYEECGVVMEGNSGPYILMRKTFSPAGLESEPGRDMVILSLFEPKEDGRGKKFEDDLPKGRIPF